MAERLLTPEEDAAWLVRLPRKPVAAKVIIRSDQGNVLLVQPNYGTCWQFPGGIVEQNESPEQGARREVSEELGIALGRVSLVEVIYNPAKDTVIVLYESQGRISEDANLTLQPEELEGYAFTKPGYVAHRVQSYYREALSTYLEDTQAQPSGKE